LKFFLNLVENMVGDDASLSLADVVILPL